MGQGMPPVWKIVLYIFLYTVSYIVFYVIGAAVYLKVHG